MTWLFLIGKWIVGALRWLIGSKEGRIALLAILAVLTFLEYGHRRYSAGVSAERTRWVAAAARSQELATKQAGKRDTTAAVIGQKTQAATAAHIEQGKAATSVAVERTRERIKTVPAVAGCAAPDPGVMHDVEASDARLRAAEDRMRRAGATAPGQ